MPKHLIEKLTPNYNHLKYWTVFGILSSVSFFVRFPFFFRDYIDRDESTFILMGQSWVDGNLPYTELWDLKPPITYLFFAIIISIFGKSFIAIRLAGVLIVAITAFYSYKITEILSTKKVALWVAIIAVLLQSTIGSLQGVMSEHVCMVFFMPALYLLIKKRKWYWVFLAGLLMGLAVMTKLNMAYSVLILGLFLLYYHIKNKRYSNAVLSTIAYGIGILMIIFLTFLPFYLQGDGEIWWNSIVLASLEYTGIGRSPFTSFVPITLLIGSYFYFAWKKQFLDFKEITIQILTITLLSILFSFIKGGRINGHYLIQLHPIFVIFIGILVSKISYLRTLNYRPYIFFILILLPAEAYLEYFRIAKHKIEKGSFFNGEGISVPEYIKENNISTENILFLGYHIGYWSLDAKPPTKSSTHPSNICRNELFPFYENPRITALEEMAYIMEEIQPSTVVIRKNRPVFDPILVDENKYINTYLAKHYELFQTIEKAEIYTLKR
ncbi:MAG: ArnT family glycosyltransferase [Maribacter sp.]